MIEQGTVTNDTLTTQTLDAYCANTTSSKSEPINPAKALAMRISKLGFPANLVSPIRATIMQNQAQQPVDAALFQQRCRAVCRMLLLREN
jgi:hypothetical protein